MSTASIIKSASLYNAALRAVEISRDEFESKAQAASVVLLDVLGKAPSYADYRAFTDELYKSFKDADNKIVPEMETAYKRRTAAHADVLREARDAGFVVPSSPSKAATDKAEARKAEAEKLAATSIEVLRTAEAEALALASSASTAKEKSAALKAAAKAVNDIAKKAAAIKAEAKAATSEAKKELRDAMPEMTADESKFVRDMLRFFKGASPDQVQAVLWSTMNADDVLALMQQKTLERLVPQAETKPARQRQRKAA